MRQATRTAGREVPAECARRAEFPRRRQPLPTQIGEKYVITATCHCGYSSAILFSTS